MKKQFYAFAFSCTMLLGAMTGCDDKPETEPNPNPDGRIAVNLKADIAPPSILKVANDQWESSDRVGLYMKKAGSAFTEEDAVYADGDNVQMSIEGGVLTSTPPLYYPLEGNVDFVAYYPYTAEVLIDHTIPVDLSGQTAGLPVEIMYSNNATNRAASTAAVPLNFRYSLAKIVVTVTGTEEAGLTAADFAGMSVTVDGFYTQARLHLTDGSFVVPQGYQPITLHKMGNTGTSATFDALVLPATVAAGEVTFTFHVGDKSYPCKVDGSYAAATQYNLAFNIDLPAQPEHVATLLNAVIIPRTDESRNFTVTPEATEKQMTMTGQLSGNVGIEIGGTGTTTIDWGDGSEKEINTISGQLSYSHNYDGSSSRTITITGENVNYLDCKGIQLTGLDVSKNTALMYLHCTNNQLTSLDASKNTALTILQCERNQLTSLDVSENTLMSSLHCENNRLMSLDVSKNTALTDLQCENNQLTSLDVSKNTLMGLLYCYDNQLTSLDVSKNVILTRLYCGSNQLTSLVMGNNNLLTILHCAENQLTSLDMSNNTKLEQLNLSSNLLSVAALNDLFGTLHNNVVSGNKGINIGNNPGTGTCNISIAEGKGWTVSYIY